MVNAELDVDMIRRTPTTLEGWRQFVDMPPPSFTLLPRARVERLIDSERMLYEERRALYHSRLIIAQTSTVHRVSLEGRKLMLLNRAETGARRGLVVSGPAATGKTTAIMELGKTHELNVRRRFPRQDRIPVVYIAAPPSGSAKKLATEFSHFLGASTGGRENLVDIADRVCRILVKARTELVIVDEIHNLNLATRAGEDMSDNLKYFADRLPSTFVYAGIDVDRSLFAGVRGKQLSGRYAMHNTGSFPNTGEWQSLVAAMDQALRLYEHTPGSLVALSNYLHDRTQGSISSLSHLIRGAAFEGILSGTERITKDELDAVVIDHAAESVSSPRRDSAF